MSNHIVFYPTIESHFHNFQLVIDYLIKHYSNINLSILHLPKYISREFTIPDRFNSHVLSNQSDKWREIQFDLKKNLFFSESGVLVIGNDSGKFTKKIIQLARKNKYAIVLLQDGWLISKNINKPISFGINKTKYFIKYLLAHRLSPFKFLVGGFIGQNSDYYFVYSKFAKKQFIQAGLPRNKIEITGSPRHKSLRCIYKKDNNKKKKDILLFLTPTFDTKDKLGIVKILKELNTSLPIYFRNYNLWIKDHPRNKENIGSSIFGSGATYFKGNIESLLKNKLNIEVAFSFNSTVILELALNKIPIIQLVPETRKATDSGYFDELNTVHNIDELNKSLYQLNYKKSSLSSHYLEDIEADHNSIKVVTEKLMELKF